MKKSKNRTTVFLTLIIIIAVMVIGYAALQTTLNILGNTTVKGNSWDVHWANVQVSDGSTTDIITAATITNPTQVEFNINLNKPGDYYEFTVDAVNAGTIDAMVDVVSKKVFNSSNVEIQLPNYLLYEVTYPEGIPVQQNQLLAANSSETIKVRVEYKRDISEDDLLDANTSIKFRLGLTYEQSNEETVIPVRNYMYSDYGFTEIGNSTSVIQNSYSSIEDLFEYPHNYFIRHLVVNNTIYSSELGFVYNDNLYYLKAEKDETSLPEQPIYEERKAYLSSLLGSENCSSELNGYGYGCNYNNYRVSVYKSGSVVASDTEDYRCEVYQNQGSLFSSCYLSQPT